MAYRMNKKGKIVTIGTGALVAALAVSLMLANMTPAMVGAQSSSAANKIATSGTTLQLFATTVKNGAITSACGTISGTTTSTTTSTTAGSITCPVTLLEGSIKSSNPVDLMLAHTQECTILTDMTIKSSSGSNDVQTIEQIAAETVRVEIDGTPVPVSTSDTGAGAGKVVFCSRVFKVSTNILNQIQLLCGLLPTTTTQCTESTFQIYLETKSAHGFNWIAPNVSTGPYAGTPAGTNNHEIKVKADLKAEMNLTNCGSCSGTVLIIIGKRTLFVDPGHFAPSLTI